jgi:hypothetical protein
LFKEEEGQWGEEDEDNDIIFWSNI